MMKRDIQLGRPVFAIPFDDNSVMLVGRITMMWGWLDFFVDRLLVHIHKLDRTQAGLFVSGKSMQAKCKLLELSLDRIPEGEGRTFVEQFIRQIGPVIPLRNTVAHGIWGWDWDGAEGPEGQTLRVLNFSRPNQSVSWEDLPELHNKIAELTHLLDRAATSFLPKWAPAPAAGREFRFGRTEKPEWIGGSPAQPDWDRPTQD